MDQGRAKLRNHTISLEQKEKWGKGRGGAGRALVGREGVFLEMRTVPTLNV